jgi:cytoskeletal protein CcmA (bactofilin family)
LVFSRKPDAARGAGGQHRARAVSVSVIGPDLIVTGNLETTGELQIDGDVQGDVYASRIVIGEQAKVVGELVADEIVIGGIVQGSIRGNTVTFQTASRIEGEVYHRKLAIEQGAYFEGKSRRSEDPTGQLANQGGPNR